MYEVLSINHLNLFLISFSTLIYLPFLLYIYNLNPYICTKTPHDQKQKNESPLKINSLTTNSTILPTAAPSVLTLKKSTKAVRMQYSSHKMYSLLLMVLAAGKIMESILEYILRNSLKMYPFWFKMKKNETITFKIPRNLPVPLSI